MTQRFPVPGRQRLCSLTRCLLPLTFALFLLAGCQPVSAGRGSQPAGAPGLGDPNFPFLGNGGYDVEHYTLDLTVQVSDNTISGTTTLRATAIQPLSTFNLDLLGFTVDAVHVNDLPAEFSRRAHELTIAPRLRLSAGDLFTTVIRYHGRPEALADPDLAFISQGWNQRDGTIFVVSEPGGAMTWYPSNNHLSDKASYTMRVTVDAPNVVAANGVLSDTRVTGNQITYVWEMAQPMATYLAMLAIGDFVRVEGVGSEGTLIRHYFPRADAAALTENFANTGEILDFYSDLIGDYPFDEYGVVVMPFPLGFALETQTLSVFGIDVTLESVNAHELVHQWFGNSVTPAAWNETWLNEGFASYLQKLWSERELGSELTDNGMRQYYNAMQQMKLPAPGTVGERDMFSMTVYERGAWVLHALRLELGDDLFRQILRTYYARFEGGNVTTADFIAVANEVSGRDLTGFLNGWIYSAEMPSIPE